MNRRQFLTGSTALLTIAPLAGSEAAPYFGLVTPNRVDGLVTIHPLWEKLGDVYFEPGTRTGTYTDMDKPREWKPLSLKLHKLFQPLSTT